MLESLRWYLRAHKYKAKVEPQEIDFVIQHVRKGQVAVDIGAYKGAFVYWMQRMVGPAGRVFAFEPQPRLAQYLRRLFRDRPNICVEQFALSDHVGHADLFVPVRPGRPEVSQLASLQD